jgi:FGGY-family pentulose kinase
MTDDTVTAIRISDKFYLGVDVGTQSARAAIFDARGTRLGMAASPIQVFRPREDFAEHSSDDVWNACGLAIRAALAEAKIAPEAIRGIGFDATCSLVALGAKDEPVSVSPTGKDAQNVIVWMDHRAIDQANRINAQKHDVLRYVGSTISPEMETPKLLWLKEKLPASWKRAAKFFDLPDFLAYRATKVDVRSLCTTTCKWTYVEKDGGWSDSFFRDAGLGDLVDEKYARIGTRVRPMGERQGLLTDVAAKELGLAAGTPVAVSIIDAHAGGVGMLGAATAAGETRDGAALDDRLALIGGTSSCHMAVSKNPSFVRGIWGPYQSAMIPGLWLNEAGQSATGALLDHTIFSHARGEELRREAKAKGTTPYALLDERLEALAATLIGAPSSLHGDDDFPAALTKELHVLPDHHGNRSPRADPMARGMVSGLKLDGGLDALARLYLATIQAIAYGTRHILAELNEFGGYHIATIVACGGDLKSPTFVREHADATGCRVILPQEPEAVLLGSAILGAVASGDQPSITAAMTEMSAPGTIVEPTRGIVRAYHDAKYRVFKKLYKDQLEYRKIMTTDRERRRNAPPVEPQG